MAKAMPEPILYSEEIQYKRKAWGGSMKKDRTLRKRLLRGFIFAALIPVMIFALFSQINFWRGMKADMERQIKHNLLTSERCLNMMLDKYGTLMYDFSTDEKITESVRVLAEGENKDKREAVQREMRHICVGNAEVMGITVQTVNGNRISYDQFNNMKDSDTWLKSTGIPAIEENEIYYGTAVYIAQSGKEIPLFEIAANIISGGEVVGKVIFSIREKAVQDALTAGIDIESYLLDGKQIISAADTSLIGKKLEDVKVETNRYTEKENKMSGFTICNVQPLSVYDHMIERQILLLVCIAVIVTIVMFLLISFMTKPYLWEVEEWMSAMNRVEKGDFSVKIAGGKKMPEEIQKIENGFNDMVAHMEDLMEQVKQAVVEQKNAELYALEAQIDPHFLYNTLDTINWKAIENGQYEISEMVGALADILRYTVYNMGGTTTVCQELGWLNQYILLQDAKKGKKIEVRLRVPEKFLGYKIHKLILQPLVENAIRHGFTGKEEKDILVIQMKESEDQLHIIIGNNGETIPPETLEKLNDENTELDGHMGVGNVRKRLKLYYGEKAALYFESEEDSYTKVHLFIPVKEENTCGL